MLKEFFGCTSVILMATTTTYSTKIKNPKSCKKYPCLIFHDNFKKLNFSTWQHLKTMGDTGNHEFQYYTNNRTNSFIRNEVLYLKPTLTNDTYSGDFLYSGVLDLWGSSEASYCTSNRRNHSCYKKGTDTHIINPIQSAALRTSKSFSFKYGKIEVKAKLPRGDWIWPAVWLMPKENVYGRWPASGEIDILESRGNDNLTFLNHNVGNKMVAQTLHWGPNFRADNFLRTTMATRLLHGKSFSDEFHLFGLEWNENGFIFTIDNEETLKVPVPEGGFWEMGNFKSEFPGMSNPWENGGKMAPFNEKFYIVLNVAVGGTNEYFNDNFHPRPPWNNFSVGSKALKQFWESRKKWLPSWKGNDVAMKIDYVKVWKMENSNLIE